MLFVPEEPKEGGLPYSSDLELVNWNESIQHVFAATVHNLRIIIKHPPWRGGNLETNKKNIRGTEQIEINSKDQGEGFILLL